MENVHNGSLSPYYGLDYISAEEHTETFHQEFGFALIIFLVLLLITILFIWVFKYYRIRLFHETGVAMIMGIIFGNLVILSQISHSFCDFTILHCYMLK